MSWIRHNHKSKKQHVPTLLPIHPPTNSLTVSNKINDNKNNSTDNNNHVVDKVIKFPLSPLYQGRKDINCLEGIDVLFYINLAYRLDRKQHCLDEIKKIDPLLLKTRRIDAVHQKDNGALGCTRSHIKALREFINHPSWKTCLIMEDDFTFLFDSVETNQSIHYLFHTSKGFDVLLLGTGLHDYVATASEWIHVQKVLRSQTASAYVVTKTYASTLLNNLLESEQLMMTKGYSPEHCLDSHWKRLMPTANWFCLDYRIGYQYVNYSDIERRICNYGC